MKEHIAQTPLSTEHKRTTTASGVHTATKQAGRILTLTGTYLGVCCPGGEVEGVGLAAVKRGSGLLDDVTGSMEG